MNEKEYIIIGDTDEFDGCLVCRAGYTREDAEKLLSEIANNTSNINNKILEQHHNFRIKEVISKNAWWNDPFLAN